VARRFYVWALLLLLAPSATVGQTGSKSAQQQTNAPSPRIKLPAHVVSVSKQITVFAEDQGLAAGLATFADKVKARMLSKLQWKDTWRHPVVIVVRTHTNVVPRASVHSDVFRTERGLKYQLTCNLPPPLKQEEFLRELVGLFCLEIANREHAAAKSEKLAMPPLWFLEGLTQNLLGDVRSIELELVERAMQNDAGMKLEAILSVEQPPPDGIEREAFKAKCKFLFRALATLSGGPHRMQRFLASLRPEVSWRESFRASYGDILRDATAAETWWSNQLKVRAGPSPQNRLTAAETDEALTRILTIEAIHRDPSSKREVVKKIALLDLRRYMDKPGTVEMVEDRIRQLQRLQLTGHQSYLPVLAAYLEVFNHLRLGRFRMLRDALKDAERLWKQIRQQNSQITASLDRHEAAQLNRDLIFLYRDYFQTFEELKTIEQSRENAIKDYLDKFLANGSTTNRIQ